MSGRNEAKFETLQDAIDLGELSPSDYSSMREISLHCASMRLHRYYRMGLLGRWKEGKEYVYYITDRGIDRLIWLTNKRTEEGWAKIKRCPVIRSNQIEVEIDVKTEQVEPLNVFQYYADKRCPITKKKTETDDSTEYWDEDMDTLDNYFESVERCRVEKEAEDETESLFKRLSLERCRVEKVSQSS